MLLKGTGEYKGESRNWLVKKAELIKKVFVRQKDFYERLEAKQLYGKQAERRSPRYVEQRV